MEVPAPGPARKRKDRDAAGPPEAAAAPSGDGGGSLLLAGLLAHEFLSSGIVLGERRGPGRCPEAAAALTGGGPAPYEAVAALVLGGGARVPGVVNPAQLAAWVGGR